MLKSESHKSKYSEKILKDFIGVKPIAIKIENNEDCFFMLKLLGYCKVSESFIVDFAENFNTIYDFITDEKYIFNPEQKELEILKLALNEIFKRKDNIRNLIGSIYNEEFIGSKLLKVFSEYKNELVAILYLNNENKIINAEYISGSLNERICVNPFRILDIAVDIDAEQVVMCHNHPSQFCRPSPEDVQTTVTIKKILGIHNVRLLNHHIFGIDGIYNFY